MDGAKLYEGGKNALAGRTQLLWCRMAADECRHGDILSAFGAVYTSLMLEQKWLLYAVLAAVSAAVVGILGKVGMRDVNPILATALRSVVMMVFTIAVCSAKKRWEHLALVPATAYVMIVLSGVAGATSWIFGFEALHLAAVSKVAPIDKLSVPLAAVLAVIFLGERPSGINWAGIALIAVGAYLTAQPARS